MENLLDFSILLKYPISHLIILIHYRLVHSGQQSKFVFILIPHLPLKVLWLTHVTSIDLELYIMKTTLTQPMNSIPKSISIELLGINLLFPFLISISVFDVPIFAYLFLL